MDEKAKENLFLTHQEILSDHPLNDRLHVLWTQCGHTEP